MVQGQHRHAAIGGSEEGIDLVAFDRAERHGIDTLAQRLTIGLERTAAGAANVVHLHRCRSRESVVRAQHAVEDGFAGGGIFTAGGQQHAELVQRHEALALHLAVVGRHLDADRRAGLYRRTRRCFAVGAQRPLQPGTQHVVGGERREVGMQACAILGGDQIEQFALRSRRSSAGSRATRRRRVRVASR